MTPRADAGGKGGWSGGTRIHGPPVKGHKGGATAVSVLSATGEKQTAVSTQLSFLRETRTPET